MNLQSYLQSRKKSEVMLIALGLTVLVGILDYLTGPLSFAIFYLIPVALAAWFAGKQAGVSIAFVSAIFWFAIDALWPVAQLPLAVHIWNAAVRFGFFIVVVLLLAKLKELRISLEQQVAERTASLTAEIAERKRLEAAAKLQFAQLASDKMWDAAYWIGQDGRFVYVNAAACRQLGYTHEEMLALNITDLDPDMTPERWGQGWRETKRMQHRIFEARHRAKDGRLLPVELAVSHLEAGGREYHFSVARDMTTRRQVEQALRESEERMRVILDNSLDLIYRFNLQTDDYDFISPSSTEFTGYTPEEFIRAGVQLALTNIHPDDLPSVQAKLLRAKTRQETAGLLEYRFRHKDGQYRWLSDRFTIINNGAGCPLYWLGVSRDVTENKRLMDALQEEQEELALAVAGSHGAPWEIPMDPARPDILPDKMIASPRLKKFIGFHDDELPDSVAAWFDRIHPADVAVVRAGAKAHNDGHTPAHQVEYRIRHKDGSWRWITSIGHLFRDQQGRPVRWAGIDWDITDRKRTEIELERLAQERMQELQAAQQQLKNIYNSSQDAIGYVDLNGHLLDFNHAFEVLTGYDATELRQMTYQQLTPAEYTVADTRAAESVIRTGQAVRYEKQYLRKDGTRVPVALTTFIVRDQAGQPTGLAAIIRDVTEQYQLQREILEISDRERRRIGQDLHDDLCQMLAGITFAAGSLEERLTADKLPAAGTVHEIGELLQRANREAHNIARGLYPAELEAGGLPMALQRLADDITRTGKARCELLCDANVVIHDQAQALHIYRIVQEAVANALRHGLATVISITLEVADGLIYLEVANNGRDWPAEIAKTSGMGLNIMAYRARMIGGTLQICRGETGGTVVDLTLPASSGT